MARRNQVTVWYQQRHRHYNDTLHEPLFLLNGKDDKTLLSAGVFIHPKDTEHYVGVDSGQIAMAKPPKGEAEFQDLCVLDCFEELPRPEQEPHNVILTTSQFHDVMRQTARREAAEETGIIIAGPMRLIDNYKYQPAGAPLPRQYFLFQTHDKRSFDELCENFTSNDEVNQLTLRDPRSFIRNRFDCILAKHSRLEA